MLEQKADREDITEPLERLTQALEGLTGTRLSDEADEPTDYSAESSHQ